MSLSYLLSPFNDVRSKRSSYGQNYLELDGLRGIAVIIVLMSHTSAFGMYGQGSLGVLLFFFLSGMVLTLPFVENPNRMRSQPVVTAYFINRLLRLVPAFWVGCLVIFFWSSAPLDWLLWNASFVKGWNHFWSVAEEARFYLLFPIVIIALSVLKHAILRLTLIVGLIFLAYVYKDIHQIDMMMDRSVGFYFWMFLGGVLTAFIHKQEAWGNVVVVGWLKKLISILAVVVLVALVFSSTYMINNFWSAIYPGIPAGFRFNGWTHPEWWFFGFLVLFLAATSSDKKLINKCLTFWWLRHIGLLSYSIYIIHMSFRFKLSHYQLNPQVLFALVFLSSYFYAYFSYILIEKPFLRLKSQGSLK